jgi:outer membrane protein TolC
MNNLKDSYSLRKCTIYSILVILLLTLTVSLLANANNKELTFWEAMELALQNNRSLGAAEWRLKGAGYSVREAKSDYLPFVSLDSGITRHENPTMVTSIQQTGVFPPLDDTIYETRLSVLFPLFNGFRTRAKVHAAKAGADEATAIKNLTESELIRGITDLFLSNEELTDVQSLVEANLRGLEIRIEEMNQLLIEGRVSPAELALVTSSADLLRVELADLASRQDYIASRLMLLLSLEQRFPLARLSIDENRLEDIAGLSDELEPSLQDNNQIIMAKAQLDRTKALYRLSKSTFFPEISGFGMYNLRAGQDLDHFGDWTVGIRLSYRLSVGGKQYAQTKSSYSMVRASELTLQSAEQNMQAELDNLRDQWHYSRQSQELVTKSLLNMQKVAAAYESLYNEGRVTLSELMTKENELLQLSIREKEMLYRQLEILISYHYTAGTLTKEQIQNLFGGTKNVSNSSTF